MKRGTFLIKRSYAKYGEETIPRPFSKKSKLSITLDQFHYTKDEGFHYGFLQ